MTSSHSPLARQVHILEVMFFSWNFRSSWLLMMSCPLVFGPWRSSARYDSIEAGGKNEVSKDLVCTTSAPNSLVNPPSLHYVVEAGYVAPL